MQMGAVLVTDDEADIRIMLRTVLRARGWNVEEAETGEEAIARCALGGLDIVVLDHRMPGLTGAETAKRLRDAGFTEPIVLYTAYLTNDVQAEAAAAGLRAVAKDDLQSLLSLLDTMFPNV